MSGKLKQTREDISATEHDDKKIVNDIDQVTKLLNKIRGT